MTSIAIIGCGFAGLATAWHLLHLNPSVKITLYDGGGVGSGASGIAAGLVHPFIGKKALLSWMGKEAFEESLQLIRSVDHYGPYSCILSEGILRPCYEQERLADFLKTAQDPDCTWWEPSLLAHRSPFARSCLGALLIRKGATIATHLYLQKLAKKCLELGAKIIERKILSLDEFNDDVTIIVTAGAGSFPLLKSPPRYELVKGQIISLRYEQTQQHPFLSVIGNKYLAIDPRQNALHLGGTFERGFSHENPDLQVARSLLLPQARQLIPDIDDYEILNCKSGLRVMIPGHLPFIKQQTDSVWLLTGLGAKGLLYHSLCGKWLAHAVLSKNEDLLPKILNQDSAQRSIDG